MNLCYFIGIILRQLGSNCRRMPFLTGFDLSAWPKKEKKNPQGVDKTEKEIIISDRPVYHSNHNDCSPMAKARLSDIADLAGVSKAAAGKVLNGGTGKIRVGKEARQRILDAARKLDYHPNMAATILAGGSSKLIGVFIDSFASYRNQRLLQELERLCVESEYRIMTSFSHDNITHMKEDYLTLQRYGVSGFICFAHDYPGLTPKILDFFSEQDNVVFMDKPACEGKPYVATSRVRALAEMIADAVKMGYRKIGMFSASLKWQSEALLHQEFYEAMRRNNLEPDPRMIVRYPDEFSLPRRIDFVMNQVVLPYRPDFLYIDDAVHAASLLPCLLEHGIKVKICGGNDDPLFKGLGIESFDPCYEKIASSLLDLLFHPETGKTIPVIEALYKNK